VLDRVISCAHAELVPARSAPGGADVTGESGATSGASPATLRARCAADANAIAFRRDFSLFAAASRRTSDVLAYHTRARHKRAHAALRDTPLQRSMGP